MSRRASTALCGLILTAAVGTPWRARADEGGGGSVSTLSGSGAAGKDGSAAGSAPRPWAAGVSEDRQRAATERLQEGNNLLKESQYLLAAQKYREALEQWDHPGVHYNLALALLNLDQPLEVHQQLELAIKYGDAPLDGDKLERAKSYLALVEKQLASIEVRCDDPGATVRLDGKELFHAPGRYAALLLPGAHTVTAEKPGFHTTERSAVLLPGKPASFELRLFGENDLIGYRRRWPLWRPLMVTAAGAAIVAGGVVMTLQARSRYQEFDNSVLSRPDCPSGCVPDASMSDIRARGDAFKAASILAYAVGGAALATGVVLLVLDRSVSYSIDPNERPAGDGRRQAGATRATNERRQAFSLTPVVGLGGGGLVGIARF